METQRRERIEGSDGGGTSGFDTLVTSSPSSLGYARFATDREIR